MYFHYELALAATGMLIPLANSLSPVRFWLNKDAKVLDSADRQDLEIQIKTLAKRMGITKDLEVIEINGGGAQALGNTLFPGRAGIAIDPKLYKKLNPAQREFLLSHELAHLKNNDSLKLGCVILLGLITYIALAILFPAATAFSWMLMGSPALSIASLVSIAAIISFSQKLEEEADKTGICHCSQEGKDGAVSFFQHMKEHNLMVRNDPKSSLLFKIYAYITISSDGENRLDVLHPSLQRRIHYLQVT